MTEPVLREPDIQALAREIAARIAPDALLDAEDVGAMFKVTARYVTEELIKAPGFPKAIRIAGRNGRRGQPRWLRADIAAFIATHKDGVTKRGGRPRKPVDW